MEEKKERSDFLGRSIMDSIIAAGYHAKAQLSLLSNKDKKATSNKEAKKSLQLPITSTYGGHCARVMNKVQKLMSLQRTASNDEELELLFAGLSA